MGHKAKWEYFRAVYERYRQASREGKQVILNEFCPNTGYNRKYAIRLFNGPPPGRQAERGVRRREQLWRAGALDFGGSMGSGRLPLVGTAESLAAAVDAVDSAAL